MKPTTTPRKPKRQGRTPHVKKAHQDHMALMGRVLAGQLATYAAELGR